MWCVDGTAIISKSPFPSPSFFAVRFSFERSLDDNAKIAKDAKETVQV